MSAPRKESPAKSRGSCRISSRAALEGSACKLTAHSAVGPVCSEGAEEQQAPWEEWGSHKGYGGLVVDNLPGAIGDK